MSNRHAIVEGEDVVNVIILDENDEYETRHGQSLYRVPDEVSPGWKRKEDEWVEPEVVKELPAPTVEDTYTPVVMDAKEAAVSELIAAGISEASARLIVGLQTET